MIDYSQHKSYILKNGIIDIFRSLIEVIDDTSLNDSIHSTNATKVLELLETAYDLYITEQKEVEKTNNFVII
jgi:hypothetical protein